MDHAVRQGAARGLIWLQVRTVRPNQMLSDVIGVCGAQLNPYPFSFPYSVVLPIPKIRAAAGLSPFVSAIAFNIVRFSRAASGSAQRRSILLPVRHRS